MHSFQKFGSNIFLRTCKTGENGQSFKGIDKVLPGSDKCQKEQPWINDVCGQIDLFVFLMEIRLYIEQMPAKMLPHLK
jgi:hypothetical protein